MNNGKMQAWKIFNLFKHVDTAFFDSSMSKDEVMRALQKDLNYVFTIEKES